MSKINNQIVFNKYSSPDVRTSLNTDAPSTNKRKREVSEEDHSSENVRELLVTEYGSHSILTSEALIVILKCDSLSSLQSVCQYRKPEGIETSDAVLNRLVNDMNKQKRRDKGLRRQWAKSMARKPGRDPIGTPFFIGLHAMTPTIPSTVSELIAADTNQKSKIKETPESTVKFGLKASPDTNTSTSSAAENNDQLIVKLKLPK
ncbi:hypothetical protein BHYA_0162g00050 [Botrytis hyacinthi]|uniref:Uncharacterized protein n=1 Tax=Botrytis hyacinthi TaxID=278943 RepID=A0A4Z1GNV3_9HELO|nr:hypothetical protein BHYA_0162g00050 [Botrytis hyacinthi]